MHRPLVIASALLAWSAVSAHAQSQALIVTGLGMEDKYQKQFMSLGDRLSKALHGRFMIPDSNVVWLGEDSTYASPNYRGRSTAVAIRAQLDRMASRAKPGEQILIVLIGHGSGDKEETKFQIPGTDLTAADYNQLLARFAAQRVAFLNLTSASGDALGVLSATNRIVVTATKSAYERNESQFARFFVEGLDKPGVADVDKDGRVSMLEAYRYAVAETRRSYESDERLITEHAQLDDDGNGRGTDLPDGRSAGDGLLSRRFFIDISAKEAQLAVSDPQLAKLYADKFATEDQIDGLKQRKASMLKGLTDGGMTMEKATEAYYAELEKLFLTLARLSRDVRRLEGRP